MDDWKLKPARDLGLPTRARLRSTRRESGLVDAVAQIIARSVVRVYLRGWHRVSHTGRGNLPDACPFVLIANHSSHLDSIVLAAMLPWRLRKTLFPLAAGDVFFETPVHAAFASWILNALPMWRHKVGRHALDDLRTRLVEDQCAYILFPEGRRSPDGSLLAFKAGLGMLVAGTSVPVVPCYIRGAHEAMARGSRWPRPTRISVSIGGPLRFDDVASDRDGWQRIASECESAVRALGGVTPVVDIAP